MLELAKYGRFYKKLEWVPTFGDFTVNSTIEPMFGVLYLKTPPHQANWVNFIPNSTWL